MPLRCLVPTILYGSAAQFPRTTLGAAKIHIISKSPTVRAAASGEGVRQIDSTVVTVDFQCTSDQPEAALTLAQWHLRSGAVALGSFLRRPAAWKLATAPERTETASAFQHIMNSFHSSNAAARAGVRHGRGSSLRFFFLCRCAECSYTLSKGGPQMPDSLPALEDQRFQILRQFAGLGDLRPGSICAVARRCGKPTCHCAKPNDGRRRKPLAGAESDAMMGRLDACLKSRPVRG